MKPSLLPEHRQVSDIVRPRVEILITLGMDSILIAASLLSRGGLLWVFRIATPEVHQTIFLRVLEVVLDYGLVASATVMTAFDLAKRIRQSYRTFNHQ